MNETYNHFPRSLLATCSAFFKCVFTILYSFLSNVLNVSNPLRGGCYRVLSTPKFNL